MRAVLDDAATVDHQDLIGATDGGESVCDDDRRPPDEGGLQRSLHGRLGLAVEVRGGLVEHDDPRGLQQQARERDALLLSAGQPMASIADHRVQPVRQRGDQPADLRVGTRGQQPPSVALGSA